MGLLRGAAFGGSVLVSGISGPRCARSDEALWLSVWENGWRGWAGGWGPCHYPVQQSITNGKVGRRFVWQELRTQEHGGHYFEA